MLENTAISTAIATKNSSARKYEPDHWTISPIRIGTTTPTMLPQKFIVPPISSPMRPDMKMMNVAPPVVAMLKP